MRKPTQLVAGNGTLYALADDGTSWIMVWIHNPDDIRGSWVWQQMMYIPDEYEEISVKEVRTSITSAAGTP